MLVTGTYHRGEIGEKIGPREGEYIEEGDKVVNDNTGDKISEVQKRTTNEGGEELWGRGENRKTNFQGVDRYRGLR